MREVTWVVDAATGDLLVEGPSLEDVPMLTGDLLPAPRQLGCARPLTVLPPPESPPEDCARSECLRVAGHYHDSLIEGPGRRSCLLISGCDLGCRGCWVPFLHPFDAGSLVPVDRLAEALLDPAYDRDGISILGGEPTAQPEGLLALVRALRARGCPHVLCYSGYTYETLRKRARDQSAIEAVFEEIDVLIDGAYVAALSDSAGPWTGSGNQRVIDMRAARRAGRVILLKT